MKNVIKFIKKNTKLEILLKLFEKSFVWIELMSQSLFSKNYTKLLAVLKLHGYEYYTKYADKVFNKNLRSISHISKIKVAFVCVSSTNWSCNNLYRYFELDLRFEPYIIVVPFLNGTEESIQYMYSSTVKYFEENQFIYKATYNNNENLTWEQVGKPNIIFQLNPHHTEFPKEWKIINLPLNVLNIYIPYGIMAFGDTAIQYNQNVHWLCWKIFCETEIHKKMAQKYSDVKDWNVVFSGYTKMDDFRIKSGVVKKTEIWKYSDDQEEKVVKIIYTPHHSIGTKTNCQFSTFDKNYDFFYQYAKEHSKTTSWIFRPHPLLRKAVEQESVFKDGKTFDKYLSLWKNLPNATVMLDGLYEEMFLSSDAMINDSVSFLTEYLYVEKPLLFLSREGNTFNDFGKEVVKIHYNVDGQDFKGIDNFINNVVINKIDPKRKERIKFFEENLDYYSLHGMSASKYIYEYIINSIWKGNI